MKPEGWKNLRPPGAPAAGPFISQGGQIVACLARARRLIEKTVHGCAYNRYKFNRRKVCLVGYGTPFGVPGLLYLSTRA